MTALHKDIELAADLKKMLEAIILTQNTCTGRHDADAIVQTLLKLKHLSSLAGSLPVDQAPQSVTIADTEGASQPLLCVVCDLVWHYTAMVFLYELPGGFI